MKLRSFNMQSTVYVELCAGIGARCDEDRDPYNPVASIDFFDILLQLRESPQNISIAWSLSLSFGGLKFMRLDRILRRCVRFLTATTDAVVVSYKAYATRKSVQ